MQSHIAVIDDERSLRDSLIEGLESEGYSATGFTDAEEFLAAEATDFDLMILDIMMPGMDGVQLCSRRRAEGHREPIIFLSGKSSDFDKVHALESGGDDFVTKPYSMVELLCRVRVCLRRLQPAESAVRHTRGLAFDPDNWRCWLNGVEMQLTVSEFRILWAISRNATQVWSRDALMKLTYPDDPYISDRNADAHIKRIRKKLKQAGGDERIVQTVYGIGYRFHLP